MLRTASSRLSRAALATARSQLLPSALLLPETAAGAVNARWHGVAAAAAHKAGPAFSSDPQHEVNGEAKAQAHSHYWLMQPLYTKDYVESIKPVHKPPQKLFEKTGYHAIQAVRGAFDKMTRYDENMSEAKWLQRFLFLETVAGVPGIVAGMWRHLQSLRTMQRDNGWIHTLLEEAENERMHLLTFMKLRQPGLLFRTSVILTQAIFTPLYALVYAISPRHCHAFVGYLEEEAVKTYTKALEKMEPGMPLERWATAPAPEIAKSYWGLEQGATLKDLILAVRADELGHSHVNHTFSVMQRTEPNPFAVGSPVVRSYSEAP